MFSKYKNLPNSVKASIWFMFCSILQKGITFFTIPVFTRLLSTDEYGQLSLFLSWQEIVSIFATLNLNYQVFNNGMVKFSNDKDGYTTSMVGLSFISSVITFLVISCLFKIWYNYTGIDYPFVILMCINVFSLVIIGLWTVRKRYEYDYKLLTLITILISIINPLLGILLVKIAKHKVIFRVISIMLTSLIFAIITFCLLLKKSKKLINLKYWKYALKIDLPLIPHYISMVLLHSSDRIMIGNIIGTSETAFYSISYNVAMVMQIIFNSINASFIPWVYQNMEQKKYSNIKKYNNLLLVFVASITLLPMFFAPEAVYILGGNKYLDAVYIIPILSASVYMIYLYSIFIIIEMYYEKSIYITIGSISASVLNLVLNSIFLRIFGYKAAAYTTLLSYIALAIFHYIMYKKACKDNNLNESIFDIKKMIVISSFIILFSIGITFLYNLILIRYLLLMIILILLILNRKKIIKLIKKIKER